MTVKAISELKLQEGKTEELIEVARQGFPDTRKYDGCKQVDISVSQDDPTVVVMTAIWESVEKHQVYSQHRIEDGTLAKIKSLLVAPPNMRFFNLTDA